MAVRILGCLILAAALLAMALGSRADRWLMEVG
jgi:hypothetical protein